MGPTSLAGHVLPDTSPGSSSDLLLACLASGLCAFWHAPLLAFVPSGMPRFWPLGLLVCLTSGLCASLWAFMLSRLRRSTTRSSRLRRSTTRSSRQVTEPEYGCGHFSTTRIFLSVTFIYRDYYALCFFGRVASR
jgi:hypothetical protein